MYSLISVLIPLYNSENYIQETITSVKNQTYPNIEIIIVDDQSSDKSLEIAKKYESENIKVFTQKNAGPGAARNRAYDLCSGQYIQYLDADDLLAPDKIELQYNAIKEHGDETFVFGNCEHFNELTNENFLQQQTYFKDYHNPVDFLVDYWSESGMIATGSYLISRELMNKAGKWNENWILNEDGDFVSRVIANCNSVKFIPESKMYYRRSNTESLNSSRTKRHYESLFESFQCRSTYISKLQKPEVFHDVLHMSYSRLYHQMFPNYKDLRNQVKREIKKLGFKNILPTGGKNFMKIAKLIGTNNTYFLAENFIKLKRKIGLG